VISDGEATPSRGGRQNENAGGSGCYRERGWHVAVNFSLMGITHKTSERRGGLQETAAHSEQ